MDKEHIYCILVLAQSHSIAASIAALPYTGDTLSKMAFRESFPVAITIVSYLYLTVFLTPSVLDDSQTTIVVFFLLWIQIIVS